MLSFTPVIPHPPSLLPPPSSSHLRKPPPFSSPYLRHRKPATISRSSSDPISPPPPPPPQQDECEPEPEPEPESVSIEEGFEMEVRKVGKKNRRVIRSRIRVDADLETVWSVLTDYEGLADFIPGLSVSRLMEKGDKFARLYQVGQQNLALGLKFDAKGVVDCYERDVEYLPSGRRRDIEFKMIEGDFQTFEGRWSIEQIDNSVYKEGEFLEGQEFQTTLSYVVELEPKLWLPVRLIEGRLCKEVKTNLVCIREQAQRVQNLSSDSLTTTWIGEDSVM